MTVKVVQSSLIRQVKSIGTSIGDGIVKQKLMEWLSNRCWTEMDIILFDSHSPSLAMELMEKRVRSIFLMEGSKINAQKQKEFVEEIKQKKSGIKIDAFHGSMTDILVPSKLKPINPNFWQKIIEQKPKLYKNYEPPTLKSPTVLIGCLPFPSQQRALLDSLFGQLILYYLNTSSKPTKHSKIKHSPSFFEFGRFSLITFLHSSQFARLLSSCPEPDLGFFSKRHQHFSFVFHSLFDVKLPSGFDGFDLSEFSPEIPLTPSTTYSKKLHEAGFVDSKLYPVQIEPKTIVDIQFGHNSDSELVIPFSTDSLDKEKSEEFWKNRKGVLEFAFWMEKTGKQGKDTVNTTMLQNLKLDKKSTPAQFAQKFCKIRELLDQKELERFKNSFEKTESETGCVD